MKVLLVEDNKGDQIILQEAFIEAAVDCDLKIVEDGVEAMNLLNKPENMWRPDLIILDLNLPKKNGREVLSEIKKTPLLNHIPVLVLSNSSSQKDVCECYSLNANAYIKKPSGFQGFVDLATMIKVFWFKLVTYCNHP